MSLTHPDKVMFPAAGITKGDLYEYYRRVAGHLLPFLRDRPVTLEVLPNGLAGPGAPHFWQKNLPAGYPDWIRRVALPTEQGKTVRYAVINEPDALLYCVNRGALTFHPWLSRLASLDRPDFVLFDLDPGPSSFEVVMEVGRNVHGELERLGVPAFVKTSGKTGLHVLSPWDQPGGFDEARAWALDVTERLAAKLPELATTKIRKAERRGRVYMDVMQNARGHHVVPPYVVRAVPAATVSMPLHWRELKAGLRPARFTLKAALARLRRQKSDPFAGLLPALGAKQGK